MAIDEDSVSKKGSVSLFEDDIKYLYHNDPTKFEPHLYHFKMNSKDIGEDAAAVSPPFWILMDHLIAVIWYMYSQSNLQNLGVVQIQWALEFIKCIKKGEYLKNVATMIDSMEDILLEKFAYMKEAQVEVPCQDEEVETAESSEPGPTVEDEVDDREGESREKSRRKKSDSYKNSVILKEILHRKNSTFIDKEPEVDADFLDEDDDTLVAQNEEHSVSRESSDMDWTNPKCPNGPLPNNTDFDCLKRQAILDYMSNLQEAQAVKVRQETEKLNNLQQTIQNIKEGVDPSGVPDI